MVHAAPAQTMSMREQQMVYQAPQQQVVQQMVYAAPAQTVPMHEQLMVYASPAQHEQQMVYQAPHQQVAQQMVQAAPAQTMSMHEQQMVHVAPAQETMMQVASHQQAASQQAVTYVAPQPSVAHGAPMQQFNMIDTNNDGTISRVESLRWAAAPADDVRADCWRWKLGKSGNSHWACPA